MPIRSIATLLAAATLAAPAALPAQSATAASTVRPEFLQGSLNVFRRFPLEIRAKMIDFYQNALGLQPLAPIQLNANMQMILFRAGKTGQIKLATGLTKGRSYHVGGIKDATGIRLFTLHYPDEPVLVRRFTDAGYPAPIFKTSADGRRVAFVRDPGGFDLQLVIDPAGSAEPSRGVEVGINVSDLARSRAFYRNFAGLEELPPVKDPVLGVTRFPFRHGETTVDLWSTGRNLPADTGSAGMQYVVNNVDAMNARALAEHVTVETPLGGVPGFNVRTVWLNDPDGVTNYFYQLGPRAPAAK